MISITANDEAKRFPKVERTIFNLKVDLGTVQRSDDSFGQSTGRCPGQQGAGHVSSMADLTVCERKERISNNCDLKLVIVHVVMMMKWRMKKMIEWCRATID
jgi:hypothetical protein